ncbi:hypothetical protein [Chitinophaga qingshengii]|uniref:Uncharacterized protein n=1 Tax=Chitinophaga qingshengii TaxID=1569794 RepID=A0ABR7TKU3_9BACT|nr:hypothetical protein [Chitinophaga qingshengii]MBC9931084.1 hypothetical protein [Chitinophaga qingshengii]
MTNQIQPVSCLSVIVMSGLSSGALPFSTPTSDSRECFDDRHYNRSFTLHC